MILFILRALFVLLMAAVGWFYIQHPTQFWGTYTWLAMMTALVIGVLIVCVDILSPRKKLAIFSGSFFGLIVGVSIAYALSFVVRLLVEQFMTPNNQLIGMPLEQFYAARETTIEFINLLVGTTTCYLAISFILQTKDDFRFIIPYVEFTKATRGARPIVLDTSVLIDGRINDIAASGILESQLIVPRFVLKELQDVADSGDKLKRNRGRRGLDVLAKLQGNKRSEVLLYEAGREHDDGADVDQRLMSLATELGARVLTNDFNLNKVAQLRGVDVININDLANALKPEALPGEKMVVRLLKPGEEPGQGVGYLDDGTMVVVEAGRPHLNEEIEFTVTNTRQTSAGKMIFGRLGDGPVPPRRGPQQGTPQQPRHRPESHTPTP
jgi:uncharacterized protein YacL